MERAAPASHKLPLLVLVSGAPGSGKTTLAAALAERLRLLHLERDLLMFGLQYTAGSPIDRATVGLAAYYQTMQTMLKANVSFVTDGTLYKDKSEPDIKRQLLPYARLVNVHCRSKDEHQRFYLRELERSGGIEPGWLAPHMEHLQNIYSQVADPLDLGGELIEVNTTSLYDPLLDDIVSMLGDRNHVAQRNAGS